MADMQIEFAAGETTTRRGRTEQRQFGLATMSAAISLLALWFGWAEVVREILRSEAASELQPIQKPAIVFPSP